MTKKDKNNKGIGGKGAGKEITEMSKFYEIAIRRHADPLRKPGKKFVITKVHQMKILSINIVRKVKTASASGARQTL